MKGILKEQDLTTLSGLKAYRYEEIDARTGALIAPGFPYASKIFSMSENAQNNLLGTYSTKELLAYPFKWGVKNDSEVYEIQDATEMATFFLAALTFKKGHQDSGADLKALITAAVDINAVNAIIDTR